MKEDTLLLVHSINSQIGKYIEAHGYCVFQVLKSRTLFQRSIRRIDLSFWNRDMNLGWLEEWYENINRYNTIIVFANPLYRKIIRWIRDNAPDARIIVWYMDPYSSCHLDIDSVRDIEEWSFDIEDCRKYGFKHSNTFYCYQEEDSALSYDDHENIDVDVFFVGMDKGRYEYVDKIKATLVNKGLKCDIRITKDTWDSFSLWKNIRNSKKQYNLPVPYEETAYWIRKSKALLDINQKEQSGISQRPLEALFYNKKLITNNIYVCEMDFYDENNIYIIQDERMYGIRDFMNMPFHEIPFEIKRKYTFEGWISQF